ncbi:MAG: hypothetical protein RIG77_17895 [Cyclobacteriaceae bacterium]
MQTTREHIESFKNSGQFEELCSAILRRLRPELSCLSQTGTNSKGQTIASPVDGFVCLKEGKNPKYVSIQHTVTEKKDLRYKWLGNNQDLDKTIGEIHEIRKQNSSAAFELILTTTQVPGLDLQNDVRRKAQKNNLWIEFMDQSAIADFLDNNPTGQWLRKQYLGIDYQLISAPVLNELSSKDLENYRNNFFLPPIQDQIERAINFDLKKTKVNLLVGKSGYGKSSLIYQNSLKSGIDSPVFWLQPEIILTSHSLEDCLFRKLNSIKPNLYLESSSWFLNELWQSASFIVDDVNRIDETQIIISKIYRWQVELTEKEWKCSFIVPLWEEIFSQLSLEKQATNTITLSNYNIAESIEVLTRSFRSMKTKPDNLEINQIASQLGHDPLLINLFCQNVINRDDSTSFDVPQNSLQKFISHCLSDISRKSLNTLVPELKKALYRLGELILENKILRPSFDKIDSWFDINEKEFDLIKILLKDSRILTLNDNHVLTFRHDRVRDEILSQVLYEDLSDYEAVRKFEEIAYSHLIGKALSKNPYDAKMIKWFLDKNPLVVFEFIRYDPIKALKDSRIQEIIFWIQNNLNKNFNKTIEERIKTLLLNTDSNLILPILRSFERYDRTSCLAGLKNGGFNDACAFFHYHYEKDISIEFDSLEIALIDRFRQFHLDLIPETSEALKEKDHHKHDKKIIGTLAIANVLEAKELIRSIIYTWNCSTNRTKIFRYVLNAYLSCGGKVSDSFFNELVSYYEKEKNEFKKRNPKLLFESKLTDDDIDYIIKQAKIYDTWLEIFRYTLRYYGSVSSLSFTIDNYCESFDGDVMDIIEDRNLYKGHHFYDYFHGWDPKSRNRKLSDDCLSFLVRLWKSKKDKLKRWFAFNLWANYATVTDLEMLRQIKRNSFLFKSAFRLRVLMGDKECTQFFSGEVIKHPELVLLSHHIWNEQVKEVVNQFLERLSKIGSAAEKQLDRLYSLSHLFANIPIEDAEELILNHWNGLSRFNEFLRLGLYIDSKEVNDLAHGLINALEDKKPVFREISRTYGANVVGLSDKITIDKLSRLKPYLGFFDPNEIYWLIDPQNKNTFEWWRENTPESARRNYVKYFPTDNTIKNYFSHHSKDIEKSLAIDYYIDDLISYGENKDRILKLLDEWLIERRTVLYEEFLVACRVVYLIGKRKDVEILSSHLPKVEGDKRRVELAFKSAKDGVFLYNLN